MDLSSSNIKKILIFSQKKAFLMFRQTETPKKFIIFLETELSYISGNGNSKKILIALKIKKTILKKFPIFWEMELYSPKEPNKTRLGETGCSSIQFFNSPPSLLPGVFYHCSLCVTYRTLYHIIGH